MWLLKDKDNKTIKLDENKIITVGRKDCEILLKNDSSISRLHAKLEVKEQDNKLRLIVSDANSKYGTFILKKNKEYRLTDKNYVLLPSDKIRFGLEDHIFTVIEESEKKYRVLTSGINDKDQKDLVKIISSVEGEFCNQWQENITHLTTYGEGLKFTEKVLLALVSGIPIVSLDYWKDILNAQNAKTDIPNINKYIPSFDSILKSHDKTALLPDHHRKTLFNNVKFYFFDECQFGIFSTIIKLSGGESSMFDKSLKKSDYIRENVIFIQPLSDSQSPNLLLSEYQTTNELLKKHQLRSIPASEISLAILFCSLSQNCNPRYNYNQLFSETKEQEKKNKIATSKILALETQDWDDVPTSSRNFVIPETVSDSQIPFKLKSKKIEENSKKRKKKNEVVPMVQMNDESPEEIKIKKKKLDDLTNVNVSNNDMNAQESFWDVLLGDSQEPEKISPSVKKEIASDSDNDDDKSNKKTQSNPNKNQQKMTLTLQKSPIAKENLPEPSHRDEKVIIEKMDSITDNDKNDHDDIFDESQYPPEWISTCKRNEEQIYKVESVSTAGTQKRYKSSSMEKVDKKSHHHDSKNKNQYSEKYKLSFTKKAEESNEQWIETRKEDAENKEPGTVEKFSWYQVKYVTLDELQHGYKPLTPGNRVFVKQEVRIPPKRLMREDFYEWVPSHRRKEKNT